MPFFPSWKNAENIIALELQHGTDSELPSPCTPSSPLLKLRHLSVFNFTELLARGGELGATGDELLKVDFLNIGESQFAVSPYLKMRKFINSARSTSMMLEAKSNA
ncbi:hypothetical protein Nepgr_025319 [Nepenthes gracilis]|uniref:Uncharacterized protein n=1 Tax=Nepenthes gracilis TaxID=150966 RepID=A0AAD3Y1C9_NEPGR|nr:hypothetical protein Nepgr_025319 [Nepenthes gracilis]